MKYFLLFSLFLLLACNRKTAKIGGTAVRINPAIVDTSGFTIQSRFIPIKGFSRTTEPAGSFGAYLRNLPLKAIGEPVRLFDGKVKPNRNVYISVVDQEIDPVNLQQCADAVMRLRAEWLFEQKRFSDIHFNFLSDSKPRYFTDFAKGDLSYKNFRKYMKYVFSYANTASLKDELIPVKQLADIQVGDVFIQKGSPFGHAVIVTDVITNKEGAKKYLLAQSYMPAQETQILINPSESAFSPWYSVSDKTIITPEWKFEPEDLRRFKN